MKPHHMTLISIIDLAEKLSDETLRINVSIGQYSGQRVELMFFSDFTDPEYGGISVRLNRISTLSEWGKEGYTLNDLLMYLEQIEFHGFREQEQAA